MNDLVLFVNKNSFDFGVVFDYHLLDHQQRSLGCWIIYQVTSNNKNALREKNILYKLLNELIIYFKVYFKFEIILQRPNWT